MSASQRVPPGSADPLALTVIINPAPQEPADDFQISVVGVPPGYKAWPPAVLAYYRKGERMAIKFSVHLEPITKEDIAWTKSPNPTIGLIRRKTSGPR